MIDRLNEIVDLVPNNGHFGKLTGILAMLCTGSYIDIHGNRVKLTKEEIIWLNSIQFFNEDGTICYKILQPEDNFSGCRIRILADGHIKDIYIESLTDPTKLIEICTSLGFSDGINFISMNYALSSNMVLLKSA